jgi:hypothetical protein
VASRRVTLKQLKDRKRKAVAFTRTVLQDPEKAEQIANEDLYEWARRRKYTIINPATKGVTIMANTPTKADLQDAIDQACDILVDVYTPEASREDLATAVGQVLDVLEGNNGEDEYEEEEDEDRDDDEG